MPNARVGLLMTGLIIATVALLGMRSIDWFLLEQSLRYRFPKVNWITTAQLASWLDDKTRPPPILLDVRTRDEWEVSHLPGARWADPNESVENASSGIAKETPIVTYCAVGSRSAVLATKLRAAGFAEVRNLEGSIFEWANEHRPLMRDDKPVTTVHPYNTLWNRLLVEDARGPMKAPRAESD